jgi:hypothetical protein
LFIVSANGKKAVEKEFLCLFVVLWERKREKEFLCLFVVLWERKREKKRPHIIVSFQGTTTADYGTLI